MKEVIAAVRQAIPDASSQPPGAVLQNVKDRLSDHRQKIYIANSLTISIVI